VVEKNTRPNPYVGPRAFESGETLYGRDNEIRELLDLLIAERIVVLYSPSGAGKTSLIRAGLAPQLAAEGFRILPVVRVNLEPPAAQKAEGEKAAKDLNRYVFSTLVSFEETLPPEKQIPSEKLAGMTIKEYLDNLPKPEGSDSDEKYSEALIFDQFEEVLTIDPTDQEGKLAFFNQLGEALRDRQRWALFSLREDYIAALDPYLRPIPTRLSNRYRLDLLGVPAARQAMQSPSRQVGVDFVDSAAQKLVDDLRTVHIQQPDGSLIEIPGNSVEPVQLQVVCYRLWGNLDSDDNSITVEDIAKIGDVNQSLSDYYGEIVEAVAQQTHVSERVIRDWFEHKLITEQGIRGQVLRDKEQSDSLDNQAIALLVDAHLVRAEQRRGATWYELAHDRLIHPVQTNNETWFNAHLTVLQRQSTLWQRDNRPDRLLLRGDSLASAEEWAAAHPDELTEVDTEFLDASRQERQRDLEERERKEQAIKLEMQARSAKRLRRLLILAVVLAIAAFFFAGVAGVAFQKADVASRGNATLAALESTQAAIAQSASTLAVGNAATAQSNEVIAQAASTQANNERATAVFAGGTAQAASIIADQQRQAADQQRATAVYNADLANKNEQEAKVQASLAGSRQLAAQAAGYQDKQPDLAALLSIAAYQTKDTREAKNVLLSNLQRGLLQTVKPYGQPIPSQVNDLFSIAMSPDGEHMAWGTSDGKVTLRDYKTNQILWEKVGHRNNRVLALSFSPDKKTLASGALDGQVIFWDIATGESHAVQTPNNVYALAYSPDGKTLAAAVNSQIYLFDTAGTNPPKIMENGARTYDLAWDKDGKHLAAGDLNGNVTVWTLATNTPDLKFSDPESTVLGVAWSPDGKLLAAAGQDQKIYIWDMERGRLATQPLQGQSNNWIYSLSFSSDSRILASGDSGGKIILWDMSTFAPIAHREEHTDIVPSLTFSPVPGELLLASASVDNTIGLDEIVPQQPLSQVLIQGNGVLQALNAEQTAGLLGGWQSGSALSVAQLVQDKLQERFKAFGRSASAAFSPDGKLLAVGGTDGTLSVLDADSGDPQFKIPAGSSNPVSALTFSQDGSRLASAHCLELPAADQANTGCSKAEVHFWEVSSGKPTGTPLDAGSRLIEALAFSPDGKTLAGGGSDQSIYLWDLSSGSPIGLPLTQHNAAVTSLAFSPDGKLLASGSDDQTLIMWDTSTQQPIGRPLAGASGSITSLAFTVDSKILYSGGSDGVVLSWDVSPDSWIDRVCAQAGRNLSQEEWQQFLSDVPYQKTCAQYQ
jgi:WD40 repeat protein